MISSIINLVSATLSGCVLIKNNKVNIILEMTIIIFKVGEKLFGLSSTEVVEVLPILELSTAGENAGKYDAVFNLRGEIIPVLNLKKRIGAAVMSFKIWNNILVVEYSQAKYGLIVDKVIDVITFDQEYKNADLNWTRLDKTDIFNWGQSIVTMLDLKNVLKKSKVTQKMEVV